MDQKILDALRGMEKSGQSEMAGVADILKTIAENGDELETIDHLVDCAFEIVAAAGYFVSAVAEGPERMAGRKIASLANNYARGSLPVFIVPGALRVPSMDWLLARLSNDFSDGHEVVFTSAPGEASHLLTAGRNRAELLKQIEQAEERHGPGISRLRVVWIECNVITVFENNIEAVTWAKQKIGPEHQPAKMRVCDLCEKPIAPGESARTPCGRDTHTNIQDGFEASCWEIHMRHCLRYECNN